MKDTLRWLGHRAYLIFLKLLILLTKLPPQQVFSGQGSTNKLCQHIYRLGYRRVLIVTDKPLVELGLLKPIEEQFKNLGVDCHIYDGVQPDPTFEVVKDGLTAQQTQQSDAILAVGGGSSMDSAKIIAAAATNGGDIHAVIGYFKIKLPVLPLFVVPTTAGTGSEVSVGAVITDTEAQEKTATGDGKLVPQGVALDPGLQTGLPPHITAATGMDALTHAVEGYISSWASPENDAHVRAAIKLIFDNLPKAYADGSDIEAREAMCMAAFYGGLSINSCLVGNVHAIAHQLGGLYHTPHGLANAIVLPHVLAMSKSAASARLAELADLLGLGQPADSESHRAQLFIDAVRDLNEELGIPEGHEKLLRSDFDRICEGACKEGWGYPAPVLMSQDQCHQILEALQIS